jgi:hypothetical protein
MYAKKCGAAAVFQLLFADLFNGDPFKVSPTSNFRK